jgi:predicted dienelactone hydrolase
MTARAVRLAHHRAAAGGENDTVTLRQLVDHLLLAIAKSLLALDIENPGYIRTGALLDLGVGVQEFQLQGARQEAPMVVLPAPMGPTRKTR